MRLASENAINLESDQTFFSEIAQPLALAKEKVNFPIFWCDRRTELGLDLKFQCQQLLPSPLWQPSPAVF